MLTLHLYDGKTGAHVSRLEMVACSWSNSINDVGSMSANVLAPRSHEVMLRPYGSIIAVQEGTTVLHAGFIRHCSYDAEKSTWTIDAGDALTILSKRLVINHALDATWKNGTVTIDEDNPSGNWPLKLTGSYSDIISRLIRETLKFGELPIVPAAITGGNKERTYNSYDLAKVADRIADICGLQNGPEVRFDPLIGQDGKIEFEQVSSVDGGELIDHRWAWNVLVPESGVVLGDLDIDGQDMCTQSYGIGGRSDDSLLVARSVSGNLVGRGWPVLQIANKSHVTVSELATLHGYVMSDTASGDDPQRVIPLEVKRSMYDVHVGDWADVRYGTGADDIYHLKVTDVSGKSEKDTIVVQCRERV